ncbi:helix-turn-helix domain-containing protein [Priestia megaterium]|uniref:helix-turn-helix domain-containing protein n=1 Tax=Priestia megaterium TaxID=1404 RepID=UPI002ECCE9F7|nr:helix-turn-helix transcriptional regulator [Priestia megaterium]
MISKNVEELICQISKKYNILMIDLANNIKISQLRLSRIENGKQDIPISIIDNFCVYFKIPLESILDY